MEIRKLYIKNIASIEECEIDFENGKLGDSRLILICGETGAGKTTILDAICLALYNNTPRINEAKLNQRYEDGNLRFAGGDDKTVGIKDPRQLVRRGESSAVARLSFAGTNGDDYEAEWSVGRTPRSSKLAGAWIWRNLSKKTTLTRQKEIADETAAAIGLDFEQFCRTCMLAQGEFSRFLKCDDNERSDILEKLTDTSVFSLMGAAIFNACREKTSAYDMAVREVDFDRGKLADEAETERLDTELSVIEKDLAIAADEEGKLRTVYEKRKRLDLLEKEIAETEKAVESICAIVSSDTYRDEARLIDDWNRTAETRNCFVKIARMSEELKRAVEEKQMFAETYKRLVSAADYVENLIAELLEEHKRLAESAVAGSVHERAYGNIAAVCNDLRRLSELYDERCRLCKKLGGQDMPQHGITDRFSDSAGTEGISEAAAMLSAEAAACINVFDLQLLSDNERRIAEVSANLGAALKLVPELRRLSDDKQEKEKAVKISDARISGFRTDEEILRKELSMLDLQIEENDRLKNRLALSVEEYVCEMRHKLSVGDDCPLCGQKIEVLHSDDDFRSVWEPFEKQSEELHKRRGKTVENLNRLSAEIDAETRLAAVRRQDAERLAGQCEKCKTAIKNNANGLNVDFAEGIEQVSHVIEANKAAVDAQKNELCRLSDKIRAFDKQRNIAEKMLAGINSAIESLRSKDAEAERIIARLRGLMTFENWEKDFEEGGEDYVRKLEADAAEYIRLKRKRDETELKIEKARQVLESVRLNRESILALCPEWSAFAVTDKVPEQRLQEKWNALSNNLQRNAGNITALEKQLLQDRGRLSELLRMQNTDEARIGFLCSVDGTRIESAYREHDSLEKKLSAKKTELESREKERNGLLSGMGDFMNTTVTAIEDKLKSLAENSDRAKARIAEIKLRLRENDELRDRIKDKQRKIDELAAECGKWKLYNDMFGDSNGNKFRRIAQSYVFKELLNSANYYLSMLGRRYNLDCQGLTVLVRDAFQGGAVRPVNTLSGGESFMVALSLALALAGTKGRGLSCNILFIDEGFGTLDGELLNTVTETLQNLYQIAGHRVAIISHVESLRERIPAQIYVKKVNNLLSEVVVV